MQANVTQDVSFSGVLITGGVSEFDSQVWVPVGNFNVRAQKGITVTVNGVSKLSAVESLRQGTLQFTQPEPGVVTISDYSNELTDMLTLTLAVEEPVERVETAEPVETTEAGAITEVPQNPELSDVIDVDGSIPSNSDNGGCGCTTVGENTDYGASSLVMLLFRIACLVFRKRLV